MRKVKQFDDFTIDDIEWGEITSPLCENNQTSMSDEDWDNSFKTAFKQVMGVDYYEDGRIETDS